jgi:hypothetical protein
MASNDNMLAAKSILNLQSRHALKIDKGNDIEAGCFGICDMGWFSSNIVSFHVVKELFHLTETTIKLRDMGSVVKTEHMKAYMRFWSESVFTSICIKSSYLSFTSDPLDRVSVDKIWLFNFHLPME